MYVYVSIIFWRIMYIVKPPYTYGHTLCMSKSMITLLSLIKRLPQNQFTFWDGSVI